MVRYLRHLERRGLASSTIQAYRSRLCLFRRSVGTWAVDGATVEAWLDQREISSRTRYGWVSALAGFYRWALEAGHLEHDPTGRVVRPKWRAGLPRPISTADLAMALRMASPVMRAWLTLGAFGGLRVAEMAGLEVGDVLADDGLLRVVGKGGRERMVPIHPEVRRALEAFPTPARGPLFRRPSGGAYTAAAISKEVAQYLRGVGVDATAHQLRHWFGSHVYRESGADIRVTQELLGHSSPTTTAVYAAWSRREASRAVHALAVDGTSSASLFSEWTSGADQGAHDRAGDGGDTEHQGGR